MLGDVEDSCGGARCWLDASVKPDIADQTGGEQKQKDFFHNKYTGNQTILNTSYAITIQILSHIKHIN